MTLIGIDFGASACVVSSIRDHTVVTIRNDLSERSTPSLVGFDDNERRLGEAAQSKIKFNYANTCRYFKQHICLTREQESEFCHETDFKLAEMAYTPDDEGSVLGYRVNYCGEHQIFSSVQCLASLLAFLKTIAERYLNCPVEFAVISVPVWYTERARQCVLDAVKISGMTCLRAMNEHAAIALDYGIFRSKTFDAEKPITVAFVNVGHGSSFVCIAAFLRGQLKILSCHADRLLSGREIDMQCARYFAKQFQDKHSIDLLKDIKARLKLEEAISKMKKVLSANSEATVYMDCIANDYELNELVTREQFEQICSSFNQRLNDLIHTAIQNSGLNKAQIDSVELVGGCCRIPWVQAAISKYFDNRLTLSRTLSMDETVSRGCALQAAILHPRYKVREFLVQDCIFEPITVTYQSDQSGPKTNVLFEKGSLLGSKKLLTFTKLGRFTFSVHSPLTAPLILHVQSPDYNEPNEVSKRIRASVKLDMNGILHLESAQLIVDEETTESVPSDRDPEHLPSNQSETTEQQQSETSEKKKKVKTKKLDCTYKADPRPGFLPAEQIQRYIKLEQEMIMRDAEHQKYRDTVNNLEAYLYSMRRGLDSHGELRRYVTDEEVSTIQTQVTNYIDWALDMVDHQPALAEYEQRHQHIRSICEPIVIRQKDHEEEQNAYEDLQNTIQEFKALDTTDMPEDKISALKTKLSEMERWFEQLVQQSSQTPLWKERPVKTHTIRQEIEHFVNFSKTLIVPRKEQVPLSTESKPDEQMPSADEVSTSANESNQIPSQEKESQSTTEPTS